MKITNAAYEPSTFRKAVHAMPAISIVYFPISSTFGLLMIMVYTSASVFILYFDPGKHSCKMNWHIISFEISRQYSCVEMIKNKLIDWRKGQVKADRGLNVQYTLYIIQYYCILCMGMYGYVRGMYEILSHVKMVAIISTQISHQPNLRAFVLKNLSKPLVLYHVVNIYSTLVIIDSWETYIFFEEPLWF